MTQFTKVCSACGVEKTLDQFHKREHYQLGVVGQCKQCFGARVRKWRKENPETVKAIRKRYSQTENAKALSRSSSFRWALRNVFFLTMEQYLDMVERQQNQCAICGCLGNDEQKLHLDHDHKSGKIRALLCNRCNLLIGKADDSAELLKKAAQYLRSHA
jgi:hypothetical protein